LRPKIGGIFLMKRLILRLSLLVFLCAAPAVARQPATGFLDRNIQFHGAQYRYQIFVPSEWNSKTKWPVILFLHGAGERGDDGLFSTAIGLANAIRRYRKPFPAVAVFPQCREGRSWTEPEMGELAIAALEATIKEFDGDAEQIYLTGLSMGGFGTWSLASRFLGKFAAIAPICPGVKALAAYPDIAPVSTAADPYAEVAAKIGKTPVWIFHGGADPAVPVEESRRMNEALKAAGGNVRYTEYEGVGHSAWDKAYAEPEFFPWLFAQKLHLEKRSRP
jgi:predicted peptidase